MNIYNDISLISLGDRPIPQSSSGSQAAVGLLRWIGGSRGLLIINITSHVRGKVTISIYDILCKGGLRDLK